MYAGKGLRDALAILSCIVLAKLSKAIACNPVSQEGNPPWTLWTGLLVCGQLRGGHSFIPAEKLDEEQCSHPALLAEAGRAALGHFWAPGTMEETWVSEFSSCEKCPSWMAEIALRGFYEYPSLYSSVRGGFECSIYTDLTAVPICQRVYVYTLSGQEKRFCRNLTFKTTTCSGLKNRAIPFSTPDKDL